MWPDRSFWDLAAVIVTFQHSQPRCDRRISQTLRKRALVRRLTVHVIAGCRLVSGTDIMSIPALATWLRSSMMDLIVGNIQWYADLSEPPLVPHS